MKGMFFFALIIGLCYFFFFRGAGEFNALKAARVGDWVSYRRSFKIDKPGLVALNLDEGRKYIVTSKTDDAVTLTLDEQLEKKLLRTSETINLKNHFDAALIECMGTEKTSARQISHGTEKITVAGRTFETTWVVEEVTSLLGKNQMTNNVKVWSSPEVPVTGVVKMESDLGGIGTASVELAEFGTKLDMSEYKK